MLVKQKQKTQMVCICFTLAFPDDILEFDKSSHNSWVVLYTLLKSNVTGRDRSGGPLSCGSQECHVLYKYIHFACKFHTRWHESSQSSEIYNIGARAQ